MEWTSHQYLVTLLCILVYKLNTVSSGTTAKRDSKTTVQTTKEDSTPATPMSSLLDMPQNDIYNNQVDEDVDLPLLPQDPYTLSQMSQISWDTLRRNNEKKSNKKFAVNSGKIIMRGPAGPRGPPGAVMTKEDIAREFKKMIKEAADKKARKIISVKCPSCDLTDLDTDVLSFFYPGVEDKVRTVNRAPLAFTAKLLTKATIMPNKQSIIENFQLTGTKYSLLRGVAADLGVDGMFRVDKTGIYQFTVTLNFHSRHKVTADKKPNLVQVAICPNGECSKGVDSSEDIAVPQYIHSMDSRQRYFTVQLTSTLELKKSEYVSIKVTNACHRVIDVQAGSIFTGVMLSV